MRTRTFQVLKAIIMCPNIPADISKDMTLLIISKKEIRN
jgi:hypothetical protein